MVGGARAGLIRYLNCVMGPFLHLDTVETADWGLEPQIDPSVKLYNHGEGPY